MSIIRHGNQMQLECDDCGTTQRKSYHRDDFDAMIEDAKDDDWKIHKNGNEWEHFCPDCC